MRTRCLGWGRTRRMRGRGEGGGVSTLRRQRDRLVCFSPGFVLAIIAARKSSVASPKASKKKKRLEVSKSR